MDTTQQARPGCGPTCIAYTEAGHVCGRPATVLDPKRGGMVCGVHAPKHARPYAVTCAFLARIEDLLGQTAEQSRKERHSGDAEVENAILDLRVKVRRIRCDLEKGADLVCSSERRAS